MAERTIPFAMRFQERISEGNIVPIGGGYNESRQMWEWPGETRSIPLIATPFPQYERPPTICYVLTRISPKEVVQDRIPDD